MTPWRTEYLRGVLKNPPRLQCGHGDDAVENEAPVSMFAKLSGLQCGHGDDAVENAEPGVAKPNGKPTLQCGHGDDAVENNGVRVQPVRLPGASMRPRR